MFKIKVSGQKTWHHESSAVGTFVPTDLELNAIMKKFNPVQSDPNKVKALEVFDNSFPKRNYLIVHKANEFTSLCPKTGQPDFGVITISYIADKKCVELKSLKYYLQSFRNEGIFYENAVNRILEDLAGKLKPKWMEVVGEFSVRGGLSSIIIATHGKKI